MGNPPYPISVLVLVCLVFLSPCIVQCGVPEFALTFNCGSEKEYRICLVGKFPHAKRVSLLSQTDSSICKVTTLKTFDYTGYPYDKGQPLKVTPVDSLGV